MKMHGKEGGQKDAKTKNHSKTEGHMVMNPSSIIVSDNYVKHFCCLWMRTGHDIKVCVQTERCRDGVMNKFLSWYIYYKDLLVSLRWHPYILFHFREMIFNVNNAMMQIWSCM